MVARNDITGDKIQTRDKLSEQGEQNFDKIFGVKKKTNGGWKPPSQLKTNLDLLHEIGGGNDWNESRVDTVGQNGNDGDHYDQVEDTKSSSN